LLSASVARGQQVLGETGLLDFAVIAEIVAKGPIEALDKSFLGFVKGLDSGNKIVEFGKVAQSVEEAHRQQ
jgi:hypothetical protein